MISIMEAPALSGCPRARHVGEPGHHLHHLVQGRPLFVRPGHESFQCAIDQPRVQGRELIVPEPKPLDRSGGEVFQEHIGREDQFFQTSFPAPTSDRWRCSFCSDSERGKNRGRTLSTGGFHPPRGPFNPDDLRAHVGQYQPAGRPHYRERQFQDLIPLRGRRFFDSFVILLPSSFVFLRQGALQGNWALSTLVIRPGS